MTYELDTLSTWVMNKLICGLVLDSDVVEEGPGTGSRTPPRTL